MATLVLSAEMIKNKVHRTLHLIEDKEENLWMRRDNYPLSNSLRLSGVKVHRLTSVIFHYFAQDTHHDPSKCRGDQLNG